MPLRRRRPNRGGQESLLLIGAARARPLLSIAIAFVIVCQVTCSRHRDPQAVLAHAMRTLQQGDTVAAFPVCAAVVSARGVLEMNQGHYAQAQTYFERVLPAARATGDQLWEANALLDLSWSALSQAHYDEALDWAYEARQISIERNSADLAQAALGNMGWAYYKLGDPEKALAMFVEARERARMLGDMADQVKWLTNAGLVHMDAHDFNVAEGL